MEYIEEFGSVNLWNHGIVELWDFALANCCEASRVEAITTVASVCVGRDPKDRLALYNRLKQEGKIPSSSFEFVRGYPDTSIAGSLRNKDIGFHDEVDMSSGLDDTVATFKLTIPQFICKQVVRHRSFSFQELTRRKPANEFRPLQFWPTIETWGVSVDGGIITMDELIVDMYNTLIENGMRAEEARSILPQGTYTTIWMQGDLPAWARYFDDRLGPRAQKEHRELANAMLGLIEEHQPYLHDAIFGQIGRE